MDLMRDWETCMNIKGNSNSHFLDIDSFVEMLKSYSGQEYNEQLLNMLLSKSLVVIINRNEQKYVYKDDLDICIKLFHLNYNIPEDDFLGVGYNGSFFIERFKIEKSTFFCYGIQEGQKAAPVFVRNIIYMFDELYTPCERTEYDVFGVTIVTYNRHVADYIENAIYRKYRLDQIKHSNFANSSTYMGSKKSLIGFIVESLWPHIGDNNVILDIMCGSGAVSNALAQIGDVYASDAQLFCRLLAKIQGAGFNEKKALNLLDKLYLRYIENLELLQIECKEQLQCEREVFHMDMSNPEFVYIKYKEYTDSVELYSSTEATNEEVIRKIYDRKINKKTIPYCLFTYYFSNVYFSLEQCMQIDSIRYAVDTIDEEDIREWALGVLVVTVSAIASNHAGHFAQPKRVDEKSICDVIERRKKSAWLEFSKRLLSVAAESERYQYNVNVVDGPWEKALNYVEQLKPAELIVYLDAPYKRDEYSRYYHVLETVALYDYPASERKGRLRSKQHGERFKTEFFSKNVIVVENNLINTIVTILRKSKVCVWSYSDNGQASISKVIDMVLEEIKCKVYLYSIPYKHSSPRKREKVNEKNSLSVMEYCVVFVK